MDTKYRVTADALNVREDASTSGKVVGFLHRGDQVLWRKTSDNGHWFMVEKGDLRGWASQKYLQSVLPTGQAVAGEPPWLTIAREELARGVAETAGGGDNPRIVEYLRSTSLGSPLNTNDETPWCSAFANWCMEQSRNAGTDSALARDWMHWGKGISTPTVGCVVVLWRGSRTSGQGHVGFYLGRPAGRIRILAGNQSDRLSVEDFPADRVLGYRTKA